jgi:hypothetical protein
MASSGHDQALPDEISEPYRGTGAHSSIRPQFRNVAWVVFEFAALDLLDDIDEALIGAP